MRSVRGHMVFANTCPSAVVRAPEQESAPHFTAIAGARSETLPCDPPALGRARRRIPVKARPGVRCGRPAIYYRRHVRTAFYRRDCGECPIPLPIAVHEAGPARSRLSTHGVGRSGYGCRPARNRPAFPSALSRRSVPPGGAATGRGGALNLPKSSRERSKNYCAIRPYNGEIVGSPRR